ncbi:MAG: hypothetical protein RQ729_09910 [Wenzhouxiangellaceae bacterium]|nr:hypothetical protein [Wenzhouxiangellaceae bacterium]
MPISRRTLEHALAGGVLNGQTPAVAGNQGRVFRLELEGRVLAVKTAAGRAALGLANRIALRREARAYARLSGITGIASCHGLIDDRWLVLDWIEGRSFRETPADAIDFDGLLATIRAMHQRGVAHGDLKRKANLRVDAGGRAWLLDFGAAWLKRDGFHPLNRRVFELLCHTDLNAWIKLKHGGYDNLPAADRALLHSSWVERWLRRLR